MQKLSQQQSKGNSQLKALAAFGTALLIALSGCNQPETFEPGFTDQFTNHSEDSYAQADALLQADYVIVLDYSYSMNDKTSAIVEEMDSLTEYLSQSEIDYRIGVIKGNTHNNSVTTIADDFMAPFLMRTSSAALATEIFDLVHPVGQPLQENTNFMLEATRRTLQAQSGSFLRKASQLVFAFVSDADDRSNQTSRIEDDTSIDAYSSDLLDLKIDPSYVSARSYVAGMSDDCALENDFDIEGERIAAVATTIDYEHTEAGCVYDPATDNLEDLARNVRRATNRFIVREAPLDGTLEVRIDGKVVPAAGNWSFKASTNELVFVAGKEPAASSELRIIYEVAFVLSKKPQVDTIEVKVSGNLVPQSEENGWSWIEDESRIAFHGSAKPAHEESIRVTYKLR